MDRFKKKTDENGGEDESENKNQYEKNGKDDCGCKLYDSYAGSLFSEKRGDFAVCNRK